MDLSFLIPSKIRRKVLAYFVQEPDAQVYVRELARELRVSPQQVYRELLNLEGWGMLYSSQRGNQRVFRLNKKFVFYSAIKDLFEMKEKIEGARPRVVKTYDYKNMAQRLKKTPVPPDLIKGLTAKRKKPRAWSEEKSLKKQSNK